MNDRLDLHALEDGALSAAEADAVRRRMSESVELQREFEAIQDVKRALQQHCTGVSCDVTWSKCQDRLSEIARTERVNSFVGRYAWQFCGAFVVLVAVAGAWTRMNGQSNTFDPSQVPNMAGFTPLQRGAADPNGFQRFLYSAWTLHGAYRGVVDGRELIRYDLSDGVGDFSVFVAPGVDKLEGPCHREIHGKNCFSWIQNGSQIMVVAERDHRELEAIAARIGYRP